ncbi:flocculation protein FLO11-like [Scomber scombrus]|uniref:Flocculation protein FLO11-like n=1 Tax=Scomber scombrus TaxID=13677 RepID=A0AAV1MZ54_SCOSC
MDLRDYEQYKLKVQANIQQISRNERNSFFEEKLFCRTLKLDTGEDVVGQEDLDRIQRQQELMELVKDNLVKGQEKTRDEIKLSDKTSDFKVEDKV